MKIYPSYLLTAITLLYLQACRQPAATEQQPTATKDTLSVQPKDTLIADHENALILNTGSYHGDEVPAGAAQRQWFGLFLGADGYYIDTTRITTTTEYDPVLDDEQGKHTGIALKARHSDSTILLITGVNYLRMGKVQEVSRLSLVPYPYVQVQPGDSIRFDYAGNTYTLFAKGKKWQDDQDPDNFYIEDYRLYFSGTKNGKPLQQLIAAQKLFDDAMIGIIFCGDLDGDQVPDFIIDTTNHYNVFQPTLYLSSQAAPHQLLLTIAKHTSMGC